MATPSNSKKPAAPGKKNAAKAVAAAAPSSPPLTGSVACADFKWVGGFGGLVRPVWQSLSGRGQKTMIDFQKGRNNYYNINVRDQSAMCRRMADRNWFLRPVKDLRRATWTEDFDARNNKGKSMADQYNFPDLVDDIMDEILVSSNVVCLWRKGEKLPFVTVLDAEQVDYRSNGGMERIKVQYTADGIMAADKKNEGKYRALLGDRMYEAIAKGKEIEIIKGLDEEWDFETLIGGKRRGVFCIPEMVPMLDCVDYVELMGVGDWNLAWARKDVIRMIKKGYPVTHGQGAGVNSVDITDTDIASLGEGFSGITGNINVPANHDVNPSYLLVGSENFDPKTMEVAWNKLLMYGGIEAVALFDSFSQQNGASPSLMRNARARAFRVRKDVEGLLNRIFAAPEFSPLKWGGKSPNKSYHWGVKSLYSMDEMLKLLSETDNGIMSRHTAREMLGLDDTLEGDRLLMEHKDRARYAPPWESAQALLAQFFPKDFPGTAKSPVTSPGEPGRPAESSG